MFTLKQWVASRHKATQAQRAQIIDIEVARKFVMQAIEEALVVRYQVPDGLVEEDLDRIFDSQPMHWDGQGFMPHHFERQDIKWWGEQRCARQHPKDYENAEKKAERRRDEIRRQFDQRLGQ